ncbi:MAG: Gfo/Idh/MocA family oxidoreductase [Gemmataceae bacterium]|nr:Gfo/Idh/MocA family oxidoreductase [Gemmataceae bacterium]
MSRRLRMAVVGVGHLGKEHARILAGLPGVELVGVADANIEQAQAVGQRLGVPAFHEFGPLLSLVDAACIATPTTLHAEIAAEFLRRGIPLLVEKPLAATATDADVLVHLAQRHGALLQVGHIERFNPAFEELQRRPLQPRWIRAQRLGPFSGRSTDIGVVLDLMIHDLDLILALTGSTVRSVTALGMSVFGGREDIANARLHFENGCVADVTASRAHPTSQRTMQLWGPEGYAEADFGARKLTLLQPSEAVRRNGLNPAQLDPDSRARLRDDLFRRHLELATIGGEAQDQLTCELTEFVACVGAGGQPRVTGADARAAVALAERILFSIEHHCWTGQADGPKGPHDLPAPAGLLFDQPAEREAA